MDRKERARKIYDDLCGMSAFLKKRCSFEDLYELARAGWKHSAHSDLKGRSLEIGLDISLDSSINGNDAKDDNINGNDEEDFMVNFLLIAALVIGIGYGVYKLASGGKKHGNQETYGAGGNDGGGESRQSASTPSSQSSLPPMPVRAAETSLLLMVEKAKLDKLYPDFIQESSITIKNGSEFYNLPWLLLADQKKETVESLKQQAGGKTDAEYAILAIQLPPAEMSKLRKDSPQSDKREAFQKFTGKPMSILGARDYKDVDLPFYGIG